MGTESPHTSSSSRRGEWDGEMATLLDTTIYYRDWLTVVDVINRDNAKEADVSDPSLQQVLDAIGDISDSSRCVAAPPPSRA